MPTVKEVLENQINEFIDPEKARWEVLKKLDEKGELTLQSFCEASGLDWHTASMFLDRFTKKGLLQKSDNILERQRYRQNPTLREPSWKMVSELNEKEMADYTLLYMEKHGYKHQTILLELANQQRKQGFATLSGLEGSLPYQYSELSYALRFLVGEAQVLNTAWDPVLRRNKYTFRSKQAVQAIAEKYHF